ncbi:DUF3617 domain-containing protein [Novosphingobium album (ex Liu et al. 2023)]|uniref:DUF3617 domain-containing protein n=1 Tax=Novosphingobium album (ex Liu et al. 2023) TaxID=3031130 RepID=A0ABT5WJG7_9SPHN|nr:DUF3617 domain-containing protein [Novosphingobium album (ex Liu et al. 2023)]MDE8650184.1 DUF3617 domain-containing protein [Novosphingobium album (ex Liu et al. 2023)]
MRRTIRPPAVPAAVAAVLAGSFALGACGSKDTPRDDATQVAPETQVAPTSTAPASETAESVAAKVAAARIEPRPGRWEVSMQIRDIDIPGLPPEMKDMMKGRMSVMHNTATCLTAQEAARPRTGFFKPGNDDCTYQHFDMAGGRVDAAMTCEDRGMTQTMRMSGTYGEESYDIAIESDGRIEGRPMSMDMVIRSRRVGECTGKEEG